MLKLFSFLGICAISCSAYGAGSLSGKTIQICGGTTEWPPYNYHKMVDGKKTDELVGFSIEVIKNILERNQMHFHKDSIPWSRCLLEVQVGTPYQMAMDASYSEQRAKDYLVLNPYYETHSSYFYSKKYHPKGLEIKNLADIKKYKICGIRGFNYTTYGIASTDLQTTLSDFPQMVEKIHRGDCDLFIEKYEIMSGFNLTGEKYLENPDLGNAPVPYTKPTTFHMMLSRNLPYSQELKELLEKGIADMQKSGELQKLLKKYIP